MSAFWIGVTIAVLLAFTLVLLPLFRMGFSKAKVTIQQSTTTTAGAATALVSTQPGYLSRVRGSMNPVTFFGILVFTAILIIFMLIPGDLVASIGTILMGILVIMIITSIVMLVSGWGSRLVWWALFAGFVLLALNPPQTTAARVTETARTIQEEGLKGVTPDLVPDFIYSPPPQPVSPEEQARRVAVAKQEAEVAEAQRLAAIAAQKAAEDEAKRAYDSSFMPAKVGPCIRVHEKETDCKTVKFAAFTQHDHYAPPGSCVMADGTGLEWIPLGNGWHRYRVTQPTVAQFFTAKGARCAPNQ